MGALVNAMMAYKKHNGELMEESLSAMNLPSGRQVRELLSAQQGLKRKLFKSEKEKSSLEARVR